MDLDKEIKKLNYALGSYKCGHSAEYQESADKNVVILQVMDSSGELVLIHRHDSTLTQDELDLFKIDAIKLCSHVKKKGM